ncbi:triose-phosphate isomerase [Sediminimonas qiaohouensis]|uniref:triose-phosphate isomerase n=1 Tax=Sediminimonas qiaohouensis TaxID=552061 RepID=UPI000418080F|nr:triose-phosphate isomerase [Sediminimonas qiaohouensis]
MAHKLAAGNWKMNGTRADLGQIMALAAAHPDPAVDISLCLPATLISEAAQHVAVHPITIGAQDCHSAGSGAHTGDIAAQQLLDAGARDVILGHSERRTDHGEDDALIRAKLVAACDAGLRPILCVGESLAERDAGRTLERIGAQIDGALEGSDGPPSALVIAYEPIWAIGTGRTPSLDQIGEVHDFMREQLKARYGETAAAAVPLLYGGSVKPGNAAEIFGVPNVDGALVGGASLKESDFTPIITALSAS